MVGFGEAVKMFFSRYVDFEGRSTRAEYWWVQLFNVLVVLALLLLAFAITGGDFDSDLVFIPAVIGGIYILAIIIPTIALEVRRFHDLNQTGWLVLVFRILAFIPLVSLFTGIGQIIWFCFPGTEGPNNYGEDPFDNYLDVFE